MSVRPIVTAEDPRLREKSKAVRSITPEREQLIADMVETMHVSDGIGLAAVQVGVGERVIVVQLPEPEPDDEELDGNAEEQKDTVDTRLYVVVNPELVRVSEETAPGIEGCLSLPGWVGEVERHVAVTVHGLDRRGKKVRIRARDLLARVFQHEIDHLNGVLFIDHIDDPHKIWSVEEGTEEQVEAQQRLAFTKDDAAPAEELI